MERFYEPDEARHELKQRKKRFVPKGARRQKRFYDEVVMAEAGVVVSRAHGQRSFLGEP